MLRGMSHACLFQPYLSEPRATVTVINTVHICDVLAWKYQMVATSERNQEPRNMINRVVDNVEPTESLRSDCRQLFLKVSV